MPVDQSKTFYIDGFPVTYQQIEVWYENYKRKLPRNSKCLPDPYFSEKCCWFVAGEIVKEFQKPLKNKLFDSAVKEDYQRSANPNINAIKKSDYWDDANEMYGETDDLIKKSLQDAEKKYREHQERLKEELRQKQENERNRQKQNAEFWKYQQKAPPPPPPPPKEEILDWRKILCLPVNITITVDIIKKAYRKEAMRRHPDKGGSMEKMMELFKARDTACYIIGEDPNEHFR